MTAWSYLFRCQKSTFSDTNRRALTDTCARQHSALSMSFYPHTYTCTCVCQAASTLRYLSEVKHWDIVNSFTFHASLRNVLSNETKTDVVSPLGGRSKVLRVV